MTQGLFQKVRTTLVPRKLTAKEIALSGVMAAVMAVAAFIPVTVVAGVGKVISAAVMLEPLIGIILGPVLGTYSAAAGSFVGQILAPQGAIFGLLTFIPPTVGATSAGLLAYKKWKAACGVMVAVLLLWYSTSIGRELYYYPYLPLIFLALAMLFRGHVGEWIHVKYDEIVRVRGTGMGILLGGLVLLITAYAVVSAQAFSPIDAGIVLSSLAVVGLVTFWLTGHTGLRKSTAAFFVIAGVAVIAGAVVDYSTNSLMIGAAVLLGITFVLGALLLLGYKFQNGFIIFLFVFCITISVLLTKTMIEENDYAVETLIRRAAFLLITVGVLLVSITHFRKSSLKKWSGITLLVGGLFGVIQQVLHLSADSQIIRKELLTLKESAPFLTSVLRRDIHIASTLDYYITKVFPVYAHHIGLFLIFVAVIVLGVSLMLHISLEKLAVAYFVVSGFAVLSDLMIGNYLAIQVLELNAGIFKAFLFIYPVERMFMAFFATIFGMGVIIPLKRYGIYNLIRR